MSWEEGEAILSCSVPIHYRDMILKGEKGIDVQIDEAKIVIDGKHAGAIVKRVFGG